VDWFSDERRDKPTEGDHHALVRQNLRQIAEHSQKTREIAEENADRIDALCIKTDRLHEIVTQHHDEARDLLEAFRFSRQLRRLAIGLLGGLAAVGIAYAHGRELLEGLRELIKP
jgi:hypothetical protein